MESLTLQLDGPITGRWGKEGWLITGMFFSFLFACLHLQVDGPTTGGLREGGGGGLITGILPT